MSDLIDDKKREMIYAAALADTADYRRKLGARWADAGNSPTPGETREIEMEIDALKLHVGRVANLAKVTLDAVDNFLEIDLMVNEADARGYELVKRGKGGDEEDDEEFES